MSIAKPILRYAIDIPPDTWVNRWPHVRLDQLMNGGKIDYMHLDTLNLFERMCRAAQERRGWLHRINSSYRMGDSGQHGKGRALDVVFYRKTPGDVDVMEQLVFALRFNWGGVGFYPFWHAPGIHVDTRTDDNNLREIWWRDESGNYHPGDTFAHALTGEWV